MSVYKTAKSPYYQYDFQLDGNRFHGSTKAKNKRDAESAEREIREKALEDLKNMMKSGNVPLTVDIAVGRYWNEKGQFLDRPKEQHSMLNRLVSLLGKNTRLDDIDDARIVQLIARARTLHCFGKPEFKDGRTRTLSNTTINRKIIQPLKVIFRRATLLWHYHLPKAPHWKEHWLKEPQERVRELHLHEQEALERAVRWDYRPWFDFMRISGRRFQETLIRWSDVNWQAGEIVTPGKGDRRVWTPITPSITELLKSCEGHHHEFVFTFVAQRTSNGKVAGRRYPITKSGAIMQWRRDRAVSGVKDFRMHDNRHDTATKLLRETRNLKLVQRVLNHANISTTAKYAHVMNDEVAEALERNTKSRKISRKPTAHRADEPDP
ncbi:Prophage DLP12 integrase [Neorhizobium galegae bv. officinalis]|uniref:Prophage DLP12 integrase n=1 Tax=Neorhizobium galegae bv. officinalis TaxID=323656 RepID=A0A0T7FKQ5_NEOGA|nr:tyrosine-type recombinase/integrase [Neorhizobium galegae]CDZ35559.1 Prophage DLP12 integrase [Neorhizobium galegae bv. officinalis]